jgi:MFS transporter, OFA family, oxalate/formate antiporter
MAVGTSASMAMGSLNFGLFIVPMGEELNIGRSTFGWASSIRQFASALTAPIVGPMLDKFGARILLPVAALVVGGAMIGLSFIDSGWQLVALFAAMGLVGMGGPGSLVTSVPVVKWFRRKRAKAIAYASLGIPIGALVFVPLTQVFIDAWGWRNAWIALAVLGVGIIIPPALILLRRQPEDIGLLPDGDKPGEQTGENGENEVEDEISWTTKEAVRSIVFWKLVIVFTGVALALGTIAVHRIPAFVDRGVDPGQIAIATAFDAVAAGISTFVMGNLATRIPGRMLGAAGFAFLAISSALTIYADTFTLVFISMAIFGLGIGGMMFLQAFIWADYFGREHLGAIRGAVMPVTLLIGGIGAPAAGYVYDITGTYDGIWWVGVTIMASAAILAVTIKAPLHPSQRRIV